MVTVTGDRYLEYLVKFVEKQAGPLIDGSLVLKLNPVGLQYVHSRLEALQEVEGLLANAPIDYLRAYVSDLGDHRALEQLRRIFRLLPSIKVVSVLPYPARDPTPRPLLHFRRLKVLELRGCDLSTWAAQGLIELRHTLEKIICHNSTDALRHVFASRISEIKASPQWMRLSFVSCTCNGLVLMDESLQLLPMVEILDLSRNQFAEVDNLLKCTRLKYLDLSFNHLRSIALLRQASCHIVNLVLRNNALTTLHGIEKLMFLEGLDLSYNVLSNFLELESLTALSSLKTLWLEGNPFCCARWYRSEVFSYIYYPHKVILDERGVTAVELWKRRIIIVRRQKCLNSYGFYSPAPYDKEGEGCINPKRRRPSRLVSIDRVEQCSFLSSDQDTVDYEIKSSGEKAVSDEDAKIFELMNKVELLKKERSILWSCEFKEWMDHLSEKPLASTERNTSGVYLPKLNHLQNNLTSVEVGDFSGHDKTSIDVLENLNSNANSDEEPTRSYRNEGDDFSLEAKNPTIDRDLSSLSAIEDAISDSPPHYRDDVLHRRQSLVEEILQVSPKPGMFDSLDGSSTETGDEICESESEVVFGNVRGGDKKIEIDANDRSLCYPHEEGASKEAIHVNDEVDRKPKRRAKRRVISLLGENDAF